MTSIHSWWLASAAALLVATVVLSLVINRLPLGVLIDSRGRYSLTHFQMTIWTILILSLILGVFFGRWRAGMTDPLEFIIPTEVLALMGISLGSTVLTTAIKSSNDVQRSESVAASLPNGMKVATFDDQWKPRLRQIFLQEEGSYANKVVDIAKYQQLIITIVLVVAYAGVAFRAVGVDATTVTTLPALGPAFLVLLAASHGTYIAGKMPQQAGRPDMSVAKRDQMMQ